MRWTLALACFSAVLWAQTYPGQYPPGQYPPGQYPPQYPGQYPPNTYPPNTYPTRLPGGVPVNLPVPEVKLPKKKEKPEAVKVTVASVEGALRKLGEKDLLLETARNTVLRFRLLAKTQFRNKAGEPIRDSLLHPGDRLSVEASPDDEETALRVVLVRSGTTAERSAAEKVPDAASIRAPRAEDLSKPRTVETAAPATAATSESAAEASPAPAPAAPSETTSKSAAIAGTDEEILADARREAEKFSRTLPNFIALQVTSRYFSSGWPARWQPIDVVTTELAYSNGKEEYRNVKVNDLPAYRPPEQTGTWSTGEFGTTLEDLMSADTKAAFKRRAEGRVGTRPALIFDFTVEQANSHWKMVSPDGRTWAAAYEGAVWIDRETHRVMRIEQRTNGLPRDFTLSRAEALLEYGFVKIEDRSYLMPVSGENVGCMSGSGSCSRNTIEFKNYRKFEAESKIKY